LHGVRWRVGGMLLFGGGHDGGVLHLPATRGATYYREAYNALLDCITKCRQRFAL
jgi:hypothetical protein